MIEKEIELALIEKLGDLKYMYRSDIWDKADRVRACYLHACLKWAMRNYLTNSSLRERFGVEERNKATISRYIKEAVEMGLIKPYDDDAAPKLRKYVPYWL